MLVPKGDYTFKVVNAQINVINNKKSPNAGKKYLYLTLEVQDEGPYEGWVMKLAMAPWSDFNWLNSIHAFFTFQEVVDYHLEDRDDDTLWVVSQLVVGEIGVGTVRHGRTHDTSMTEYASVIMKRRMCDVK